MINHKQESETDMMISTTEFEQYKRVTKEKETELYRQIGDLQKANSDLILAAREGRRLMQDAVIELQNLRRTNELFGAKIEMIEFFRTVLETQPPREGRIMSEDVVYKIDQFLKPSAAS